MGQPSMIAGLVVMAVTLYGITMVGVNVWYGIALALGLFVIIRSGNSEGE